MSHHVNPEYLSPTQRTQLALTLSILLLVTLVACSACGAQSHMMPTDSDPAVARQISPEGNFQCTAWKVGENFVMTAGHCCEKDYSYTMEGDYAVPGAAYVTLIDDDVHDVCVMKGHLLGATIRIAKRDPVIGEQVWTQGYPRGVFLVSTGYWSGRNVDYHGGVVSTVGGYGSSGSAVLDGDNMAVGVVSRRFPDMDNLTFVSTIEWMRRALVLAYQAD